MFINILLFLQAEPVKILIRPRITFSFVAFSFINYQLRSTSSRERSHEYGRKYCLPYRNDFQMMFYFDEIRKG
jgi:hypothetical protein